MQSTLNKTNLNSIGSLAFNIPSIKRTRKDIPRQFAFSRNSRKLAMRTNSLMSIKEYDDRAPGNEDDFMAQYYPKLLFIENRVGRII